MVNNKKGRISIFICLILFAVFFAIPCRAQEIPAWEFFGAYSRQKSQVREYFRSTPILFALRNRHVYLSGWQLSVTENRNHWFGGTLDVRGHYKTRDVFGTTNRQRMYSILYGPRFAVRTRWVVPSAHLRFGVAHAKVKVTPVGPSASDTSFAMAAGVGFDVNLRRWVALRVFQGEYFRSNLLGNDPDHYQASAGIVFYVGTKQ